MKIIISTLTMLSASLLITAAIIPLIKKLAIKYNLIDAPDKRKKHHGNIPLIGGIAIALSTGVLFSMWHFTSFMPQQENLMLIFLLAIALLILGILDDMHDISAKIKLLVQLFLAHLLFINGLRIETLYGFFGIHEMHFYIQYILTLIVIAGVINAYNLMDGIDGLLGSIALNTFIILAGISWWLNMPSLMLYCIVLAGSSIAFLKFNFSKKNKIFLGDAGSFFIGFNIASIALILNKASIGGEYEVQIPVWMIGLMSLPVIDSIRVYLSRIVRGKNPLKADRSHFHHFALKIGLSPKRINLSVSFVMVILVLGLSVKAISNDMTKSVFLVLTLLFLGNKLIQFLLKMNHWKKFINDNSF